MRTDKERQRDWGKVRKGVEDESEGEGTGGTLCGTRINRTEGGEKRTQLSLTLVQVTEGPSVEPHAAPVSLV